MKLDISKYNAFIFDFDGVIVDSLDIKTRAFGELFKKYGSEISEKVMDYHRKNGGVSRYEKFKYYYKNLLKKEINQEIIDKLDADFSKLVAKKVIKAPFIPGALRLLNILRKNLKNIFLISATPRKEINMIIKKRDLSRYFVEIKGSPPEKSKNLEMIVKKFELNPRQCVYFGDSREDLKAAKINRVNFIPINYIDKNKGSSNFSDLLLED
jgi:beta-phosphoglucomutase-like phosphatase (HAD superfamily)